MKKGFLETYFPAAKHANIPNAITSLGLVFGIFVCYYLTQRDLRMAIIFLFFVAVMDACDGFVASKLNQQSEFGQYLDTLVDFFSCCIIPIWMVHDFLGNSPLIVGALIVYCICGLWRLAYYNIIEADKTFTGLPVPGAMMIITIAIWIVVQYHVHLWLAAGTMFVVGLLMISGIKLKKYGIWQIVLGLSGLVFLAVVIFS